MESQRETENESQINGERFVQQVREGELENKRRLEWESNRQKVERERVGEKNGETAWKGEGANMSEIES